MMELAIRQSAVDGLRDLADAIERGDIDPDTKVVVIHGDLGEPVFVRGMGKDVGGTETLAMITVGQHIMLNAIMPLGNNIPPSEE